jgi:hypothetical protein
MVAGGGGGGKAVVSPDRQEIEPCTCSLKRARDQGVNVVKIK